MVLMDVMMREIDGFEAVRYIRSETKHSDLPIIMVTSLAGKEDRLRAVDCGANDFISKPVEKIELQIRVTAQLKLKWAMDSVKQTQSKLEAKVMERTDELRKALQSSADASQRIYTA